MTEYQYPEVRENGDGAMNELSENDRNLLFQKALNFEASDDLQNAEQYYLQCMGGLKRGTSFSLLPQCLRNLADIYYKKGDYDKAVNFVKAEKFYYETVLIDTKSNQNLNQQVDSEDIVTNDIRDANLVQAEQYEHLARLCLDNQQSVLALEYAGKAARLRQASLGDDHPTTKDSLNLFATIYAEVGKQQYSQNIETLGDSPLTEMTADSTPATETVSPTEIDPSPPDARLPDLTYSPTSILRQRRTQTRDIDETKRKVPQHVHFDEAQLTRRGKEDQLSRQLLWVTLALSLLLLFFSFTLLFCHSYTCPTLAHYLHNLHTRVSYYYYRYTTPAWRVS